MIYHAHTLPIMIPQIPAPQYPTMISWGPVSLILEQGTYLVVLGQCRAMELVHTLQEVQAGHTAKKDICIVNDLSTMKDLRILMDLRMLNDMPVRKAVWALKDLLMLNKIC
jgi:hypothetical protein